MEQRVSVGYMDKVDFDYHLGNDLHGATIYPSVGALRECKPCVKSCGIVSVEVRLKEVIQEEQRHTAEEIREMIRKRKETVGSGGDPKVEVSDREPGQAGN